MTEKDFKRITDFAMKYTGIVLTEKKVSMVYSRISRRLRALKMTNCKDYLDYLDNNFAKESDIFINLLTTNLTAFFRESHHFDFLKNTLIPQWKAENKKSLRIWSSGCSIGQEAYSIAMVLAEAGLSSIVDIKILATDLDSNVIETGKQGVYPLDSMESIPKKLANRYVIANTQKKMIKVKDELRSMVHFKRLNLLEEWPLKSMFDVIFCRNVVIYFNRDTQKKLFNTYANYLPNDSGYLVIGHSESLKGLSERFESIGNTIYRKIH